jgi:ATP-binding cassette subfamily F protein uup
LRNSQKEHAAAGRKIEKLGAQIAELHVKMAEHDQSDYAGLGVLSSELASLQDQLDTVEFRWLELEELLS